MEGVKVVREALAAGVEVESVYVDRSGASAEAALEDLLLEAYGAGSRIFDLAPGVLGRVADTVTPQPVMAVVREMDVPLSSLRRRDGATGAGAAAELVVVCVDLRDPGNAGTVLRSAEAAGATGVVCCDGSVDLFNPKTVRASAGAMFRLPVVSGGDPVEVLAELGSWGLRRLASAPRGGNSYTDIDLTGPVALVLGNEAHGLPARLESALDGRITIPMAGRAESLNAGMAGAVLCFEAARQRRERIAAVRVAGAADREAGTADREAGAAGRVAGATGRVAGAADREAGVAGAADREAGAAGRVAGAADGDAAGEESASVEAAR